MANESASVIAGRRIREERQRRGWTARELASRCAQAGAPHVTFTVITNLETRRRSTREISLDEVLVLASVLEVPPLQLMVPLGPGERLQVLPGTELDALEAARWIAGDTPAALIQWTVSAVAENTGLLLRYPGTVIDTLRQIGAAESRIARYGQETEESPGSASVLALVADRLMHLAARLEALGYEAPVPEAVREALKHRSLPQSVAEWRRRAGEEVPGGEG